MVFNNSNNNNNNNKDFLTLVLVNLKYPPTCSQVTPVILYNYRRFRLQSTFERLIQRLMYDIGSEYRAFYNVIRDYKHL